MIDARKVVELILEDNKMMVDAIVEARHPSIVAASGSFSLEQVAELSRRIHLSLGGIYNEVVQEQRIEAGHQSRQEAGGERLKRQGLSATV